MSAIKPEIWTYDQFKTETNPKDVRKALVGIDGLLKQWAPMKDGNSTEQRMTHLRKLVKACVDYLQIKEGKEQKKLSKKGGKASPRLVNRIAKVKQLTSQIFLRLAFERYKYQKVVRSGTGTKLAPKAAQATGLKGSYGHERSNFEAIKGGQNLGGTQTAINPQGASFVHQQLNDARPENIPPNLLPLFQKGFDNLSLQEFNTLQNHFAQGQQGLGALPNVHYARKDERFRDLMLVPLDGLLYKTDGSVCDVKWNAYALDIYGNLMVAKANRTWNHGVSGAQFNHSTLCAGRDVICAGEIKIEKGLITYISNESGHYKPSADQLANAIRALQEEYSLPLLITLQEIVDVSTGNKVSYQSGRGFLNAHPGV